MTQDSSASRTASPVFYDFEATGLDGIPIEIGWAYFDAATETILSEAYLIRAAEEWELASVWDERAQEIHGIELETVLAKGKGPVEVLSRMNAVLNGRELFADSPFDPAWLRQLFELADLDPSFHMRVMLSPALCDRLAVVRNIDSSEYAAIKAKVERNSPITHRADADARYWAHLWLAITSRNAQTS
jgi:hypothetical protein